MAPRSLVGNTMQATNESKLFVFIMFWARLYWLATSQAAEALDMHGSW